MRALQDDLLALGGQDVREYLVCLEYDHLRRIVTAGADYVEAQS